MPKCVSKQNTLQIVIYFNTFWCIVCQPSMLNSSKAEQKISLNTEIFFQVSRTSDDFFFSSVLGRWKDEQTNSKYLYLIWQVFFFFFFNNVLVIIGFTIFNATIHVKILLNARSSILYVLKILWCPLLVAVGLIIQNFIADSVILGKRTYPSYLNFKLIGRFEYMISRDTEIGRRTSNSIFSPIIHSLSVIIVKFIMFNAE